MTARVRLAPSPTGTLHIGTARTALYNWLFARKNGGKFLLRIEDTDKERSKEEYVRNILEGLEWLGIKWDETPVIQSEQLENHKAAIKLLLKKGLAYRCYATENELEEMREAQKSQGKPPRYDNRHRDLTKEQETKFLNEGRTSVVRFRIEDETKIEWNDLIRGNMRWEGKDLGGDIVISRRAKGEEIGYPLYNLVVAVDDSAMGISHVIRGEDHLANTAKQILIYKALELKIPEFAHTPLILNQEGRKLSKRDGVTSISDFKAMGYTSEALANYMTLLGWSPPEGMDERFTLEEAKCVFDFSRVNKAGARFDWEKLNWLNSQIIHSWQPETLLKELEPLWRGQGWELLNHEWALSIAELIGPSLTLINDGIEQSKVFFEPPVLKNDAITQLNTTGAKEGLKILQRHLEQKPWDGVDKNHAKELLTITADSASLKKGLIMKSLRAALFGCLQGPDLLTTWSLLAQAKQDISRIKSCL